MAPPRPAQSYADLVAKLRSLVQDLSSSQDLDNWRLDTTTHDLDGIILRLGRLYSVEFANQFRQQVHELTRPPLRKFRLPQDASAPQGTPQFTTCQPRADRLRKVAEYVRSVADMVDEDAALVEKPVTSQQVEPVTGQQVESVTGQQTEPARKSPARKGRPKADFETTEREAAIAADWKRARDEKVYKADFARERGLTVTKLDALLDRVRKRNSRLE